MFGIGPGGSRLVGREVLLGARLVVLGMSTMLGGRWRAKPLSPMPVPMFGLAYGDIGPTSLIPIFPPEPTSLAPDPFPPPSVVLCGKTAVPIIKTSTAANIEKITLVDLCSMIHLLKVDKSGALTRSCQVSKRRLA